MGCGRAFLIFAALLAAPASAEPVAGRSDRCRILLTNDDGVHAPGILALYRGLVDICDVVVAAPSADQSGASLSVINVSGGTKVSRVTFDTETIAYAVSGSPAEAVAIGILALAGDRPFNLVVSGINYGENTGIANLYSGTVNAAVEAAIEGLPAIAISQARDYGADYTYSVKFSQALVKRVLAQGLPSSVILNVNVPKPPVSGVSVTQSAGSSVKVNGFDVDTATDGTATYTPRMRRTDAAAQVGDSGDYARGMITIAPIELDRTAASAIDGIKGWQLDLPN